ncbi:glucosamine-6-phosphate deaminase [Corynebacterium sp. TA-R-1]|uniref:Glucosamine-6-phosphate deaminase n=1 Tax=Corynebacterium stercoris TaxID=2943490 RepID=A0ABT1FZP9_9CORY|nr:glucosamine-6-phosphate deaminase [Corynebacterium stercoris]MCP1387244.1 glucosamine-6-phosphate deaminase [Corynebacterium stercoris]
MEIIIRHTPAEVAQVAASLLEPFIRTGATLGLATGSTPNPTYQELIRRHREEGLSFAKCRAFLLDEYYGLPASHEQSYHATIRRELTHHIDIADENVHSLDGAAVDPAQEVEDYEEAIEDAGGVDIQILGIGTNGHIAFNEPTSSLRSRTRLITLHPRTVADNARFFDSSDEVPRHALTQGIGTIMEARHLILIATGPAKADAARALIEGPLSASCPASALQLHNNATVLLDEAAAANLEGLAYYKAKEPYWPVGETYSC